MTLRCRDVVQNDANPSVSTKDPMDGVAASIVRIRMQRPHPRLGKVEEKYRYAIKEISILANKLESAIGDCRESANSDDARDKYFISYVTGVDPAFVQKTAKLGVDVIAKMKNLQQLAANVEERFTEMEECRDDKKQQKQHIATLRHDAGRLLSSFQTATEKPKAYSVHQLLPGTLGPSNCTRSHHFHIPLFTFPLIDLSVSYCVMQVTGRNILPSTATGSSRRPRMQFRAFTGISGFVFFEEQPLFSALN